MFKVTEYGLKDKINVRFFLKYRNQSRKPQYLQIALQKKGNRRRLWRLAVATHPLIAEPTIILNIIGDASVPLRGTNLVEISHVPTAALLRSLQWVFII